MAPGALPFLAPYWASVLPLAFAHAIGKWEMTRTQTVSQNHRRDLVTGGPAQRETEPTRHLRLVGTLASAGRPRQAKCAGC